MTISLHTGQFAMDLRDNQLLIVNNTNEEDYWKFSSEDIKVEYSKGRLFIHTPASINHEEIFGILYLTINNHLSKTHEGKMLGSRVAVKLPNGHRPEPDLLYVGNNQYDRRKDLIFTNVPRWIIEIISPSTRDHDFNEKLHWFKDANVEEIWIVDAEEKELHIYKAENNAYSHRILSSGLVTPLDFDFSFDVSSLWI